MCKNYTLPDSFHDLYNYIKFFIELIFEKNRTQKKNAVRVIMPEGMIILFCTSLGSVSA